MLQINDVLKANNELRLRVTTYQLDWNTTYVQFVKYAIRDVQRPRHTLIYRFICIRKCRRDGLTIDIGRKRGDKKSPAATADHHLAKCRTGYG